MRLAGVIVMSLVLLACNDAKPSTDNAREIAGATRDVVSEQVGAATDLASEQAGAAKAFAAKQRPRRQRPHARPPQP